jgi:hypothetical protein
MTTRHGKLAPVTAKPDPDELLTYADIARMLGVSPATAVSLRRKGYLPPADEYPVPDRPRWRRSTIEAWIPTRPGRGAPGRPRSTGSPEAKAASEAQRRNP